MNDASDKTKGGAPEAQKSGQSGDPCPKEKVQQKSELPGLIGPDEAIVYILLQPIQWDNGALASAAFSSSKLGDSSLSVCRGNFCTAKQAHEHVVEPQLAKDARRRLVGAFKAQCSDIRAIEVLDPRTQIICVFDDGTMEFAAHALLGYCERTKEKDFWKRNQRTAVRSELTRVFNEKGGPLPLAQCCAAPA